MQDGTSHKQTTSHSATGESYLLTGRVRRMVVVTAVAVAAIAVVGHLCATYSESRRAADNDLLRWARCGAAQLAGLAEEDFVKPRPFNRLEDRDERVESDVSNSQLVFKQWSLAVMIETEAAATALVDAQGKVLASWPTSVDLGERLAIPPGSRVSRLDKSDATGGPPGLTVAIAPLNRGPQVLPLAYACVFARTRLDAGRRIQSAAIFVGGLAVSTVIVLLLALNYARRRIFEPLSEVNARVSATRTKRTQTPSAHQDDFDKLVCNVHALCDELDAAHRRADSIEGSIDTVVERRTKHISRLLRRAETDAEIDPLTKLANRRFIQRRLDGLIQEQLERNANLIAAVFDVDNFKSLNDTEGHATGDKVLRFVGELLRGSLRENDVGVRLGGDEFAVLMADVSLAEATEATERIVHMFAQRMRASRIETPVTLSAGVAALDNLSDKNAEQLLHAADEALYESKRAGKNAVHQA